MIQVGSIKLGTLDLEKCIWNVRGRCRQLLCLTRLRWRAEDAFKPAGLDDALMSLDDTLDDSLAEWMYGCRVPNSGVLVREAEFSAQLFHVSVRIMEKIEKTITNPGDADRIVEYCGMLWNKYRHVYFIYIYILLTYGMGTYFYLVCRQTPAFDGRPLLQANLQRSRSSPLALKGIAINPLYTQRRFKVW